MNQKTGKELTKTLQVALVESRRGQECITEAIDCAGFAGTTADDVVVELQDADACSRKANGAIAEAQRALRAAKPIVGQALREQELGQARAEGVVTNK